MASSEGYEPIDHTADVGLRVWAADLAGLFRVAGLGLTSLLTDRAAVRPIERVRLRVTGIDLEELLVAWLNEMLYRFDLGGFLFADFEELQFAREAEGEYRLEAFGLGEHRSAKRHPGGIAVKAATYHGLRVVPDADGRYDVAIILDT